VGQKKNDKEEVSLFSILKSDFSSGLNDSAYEQEENKLNQALLERPSFSVKARLTLAFFILFLVSATISITAMIINSRIKKGIQLVTLADKFANEIQHVRRIEKNYFLYGSDLSEVSQHLDNAQQFLERASFELGHDIGSIELGEINHYLGGYRLLSDSLIKGGNIKDFMESKEYQEIAVRLRDYGSKMLETSLDISKKERQFIFSATENSRRIILILIAVFLFFSIFIASHIYKHIITRLNRLMVATQQFASGDFLPITPKRKYRDEFSLLVIALNHMMYELDKRQQLLIESHRLRAIGNLTAGVAHELNNPINNIILTAEVLKDGFGELSKAEIKDAINDLVNQGERAQQIVKNLLDYARESETQSDYLYINEILEETVQLVKNQIKLSKISLEENYRKTLSPIYGDRKLLVQVFLNLILNAIDAMPKGGNIILDVTESKQTGFLSVTITDTGTGISDHILNSIFNPFFTTKPTGQGTGLGLAVSRGIIEKHGGSISVKSSQGVGTTFTVHLPTVPIPADIKDKSD